MKVTISYLPPEGRFPVTADAERVTSSVILNDAGTPMLVAIDRGGFVECAVAGDPIFARLLQELNFTVPTTVQKEV